MIMSLRRSDWFSLGTIAVTALATAAIYGDLPVRVATHFDMAGNPNGWMPRPVAAAFGPVAALVLWAIVRFVPRALPTKEQQRLGDAGPALVAALMAVFMAVVQVIILAVALTPSIEITRVIWLPVGGLFIALGLVLPRIRRNGVIGIRTPWTMTSDENWARTHRVAGYCLAAGGVLAGLLGLLVPAPLGGTLAIGSVLVSSIVPAIYSLLLARRLDPS
jgi:uncharacterized membrane protein